MNQTLRSKLWGVLKHKWELKKEADCCETILVAIFAHVVGIYGGIVITLKILGY